MWILGLIKKPLIDFVDMVAKYYPYFLKDTVKLYLGR